MPDPDVTNAESRKDIRGGLPVSTVLGGYELRSIIGKGAFGITYRARDLTLGRDVAIKEYLPTTLALREDRTTVLPISADHAEQFAWGRERFLEEARTLARLDRTPAIVRVYDYFEANGTAYMVMGLVEGENLSRRLTREGRLTPEAVERLLFPLLDGLEEVHGIGFLHRDIKPANIMVDARGRPTLIDFGAARAAMAGRSTTMTAIFTPGYAAAEQYTSAELGPWTDVYGLAATLYHGITGKIPLSSIERILNDTHQPLSELRPEGYPPELLAGIDAGLERSVDDRPQGIAEWRHVLRTGERQSQAMEATQVERKSGRLARMASRTRKAGLTLRGPALWGAAAAAALVLAGGGYLAFTAGPPTTIGTAVLSLSAEQLEQALAERRKADTFAAEKRRLEEEARQKAEAEAEAKRQAEAELEQARQARQKAEEELAELKARIAAGNAQPAQPDQAAAAEQRAAEEAAQRKAEADAAALRQAEEEARKKVEAEAEAKRQAEETLANAEAERRRAEEEARVKAEAEQAALRKSSEQAQRKAVAAEREKAEAEAKVRAEADKVAAKQKEEAEAAEKALRLEQADRQRLQVALTSLGFDTRGNDGVFGPRSRDMIAGWQKKAGAPATGFLAAAQRDQLLRSAVPAVTRWDEEQKKIEDEKKKPDVTQAAATLNQSDTGASAPPASGPSGPGVAGAGSSRAAALRDGTYGGGLGLYARALSLELRMRNSIGAGTVTSSTCGTGPITLTVDASGNVTGEMKVLSGGGAGSCTWSSARITGRAEGGKLLLTVKGDHFSNASIGEATLTLGGASQTAAAGPPALPSPDGLWRGTYACGTGGNARPPITLDARLSNGAGAWKNANPTMANALVFDIQVSIESAEARAVVSHIAAAGHIPSSSNRRVQLMGRYDGNVIQATGKDWFLDRDCTLALKRA